MKLTNEEKCTYCREYGNLPCEECYKKLEAKKAIKTKFTKVAVSERLPEETGYYFTDEGISYFVKGCNEWSLETLRNSPILEWFEESPDREDEMREMLEKIIKDFEGDYVIDEEIVDKPYQWLIDRYKESKSLLQSLKQEK